MTIKTPQQPTPSPYPAIPKKPSPNKKYKIYTKIIYNIVI